MKKNKVKMHEPNTRLIMVSELPDGSLRVTDIYKVVTSNPGVLSIHMTPVYPSQNDYLKAAKPLYTDVEVMLRGHLVEDEAGISNVTRVFKSRKQWEKWLKKNGHGANLMSEVKEDVVEPSRMGKHAGRGSPELNDKQFEATRRFWW